MGILGHVNIPAEIGSIASWGYDAWQDSGRLVWEIYRKRPWQCAAERAYLDEATADYISSTLESFNIAEYDASSHSLMLFGDVQQHNDGPVRCNNEVGAFFHLILSGSGTLRLPGLRDSQSREVKMTKGLAFWFNPRYSHLVKNASAGGLASLTATIRLPR